MINLGVSQYGNHVEVSSRYFVSFGGLTFNFFQVCFQIHFEKIMPMSS